MSDTTAATLIRQVESLGYVVSIRSVGSSVVMVAVTDGKDDDDPGVRGAVEGSGDTKYHAACRLAQAVGIDLLDG